jgi:predicted ATPase
MSETIRLAFTGASGTGKSTLATAIAKKLSLPICPTGSREIAKEMGFDSPYDVDAAGKRAEFQQRLFLDKLTWEQSRRGFVTDRTYLDNLAYTFLHAPALAMDAEFVGRVYDAMTVYTHIVFCPLGAFQDTGDDPARVHDAAYHRRYEDYLVKLMQGNGILGSLPPILWLNISILGDRLLQVERFVRPRADS